MIPHDSAGEGSATPTHTRQLVPVDQLPANRPRGNSQPCAACGTLLDPLRAPEVLVFDDGFRFLCGPECLHEFRQGTRHRLKPTPSNATSKLILRNAPLSPPRTPSGRAIPLAMAPLPEPSTDGLALGAAAVLLACTLGAFSQQAPWAATASTICSALAAAVALWASWPAARDSGIVAWAIGPAGVMLAAFSAQRAGPEGVSWLAVEGAALAASAMLVRAWLDARGRRPVEQAVHQLVEKLPARLHVPVADAADPLAMSVRLVDAQSVRIGEEVVALRGETLAVDGVVQAGNARVLPFPGATTAIRRGAGDPLVAGATIEHGALRVLVTRAGDERALVRLGRFASAAGPDAAPLARMTDQVTRWGGLGVVALALAVVLVADSGGMTAPLSAAAAVLLVAPLLAARRAAGIPLLAAAACAARRGIVFHSGASLETTGRASLVALSPHGVLTEGKPEVVEFHPLEQLRKPEVDLLIAVAAAAESAVAGDPLARAVVRFARTHNAPAVEVRRPVYHAGLGVTAISPQGQPLVVGSRRLMLEEGISVALADAEAARAEASGRTPIFVALDGRVRAVMTLQDELRVGARAAVQRLFDLGLEVVLLTGNQRGSVQSLAAALDIEHIKAELSPEERGQEVRSLREAGTVAAAIGHPGDDDAALAAAHAGIVLSAAGGSAAERAAALVTDDVRDAADALWIARAAREAALRALRLAAVVFAAIVAAAAFGLVIPAIAALLAMAVDAYGMGSGARLLRRIALRLPSRT